VSPETGLPVRSLSSVDVGGDAHHEATATARLGYGSVVCFKIHFDPQVTGSCLDVSNADAIS
jgi:hypothetical protein